MYEKLKCLGIEHLIETEEATLGLISHVLQKGKAKVGYSGEAYIFYSLGYAEFIARTKMNHESKEIEFAGMDVHCSGPCCWEIRVIDDITPEDWVPARRRLVCKDSKDGSGIFVINVMLADVLPSFVEDDLIQLQLVAFPLSLDLYENEEAYVGAQPDANVLGRKMVLGSGSLFPIGLMSNRAIKEDTTSDNENRYPDDIMIVRGTIKSLAPGKVVINDKEFTSFIDCIIETLHGGLEVVFTLDQIPENQRKLLKAGSVLSAPVILSGDAAIKEYNKSFVKDEQRHLALLRHTFLLGHAERLRFVLSEQVSYYSEVAKVRIKGKDGIIAHLDHVCSYTKGSCVAELATIIEPKKDVDSEEKIYLPGTRCIAIAYNKTDNFESLAFINLDQNNNIEKIYLASSEDYIFKIDEAFEPENEFDELKLPEFVGDSIVLRAQYHNIIEMNVKKEDVYRLEEKNPILDEVVSVVIDTLKAREIDAERLKRVFSFVFAKSSVAASNNKPILVDQFMKDFATIIEGENTLTAPSNWEAKKQEKYNVAVDLAKQFQKDYTLSEGQLDLSDEKKVLTFRKVLKIVLQLGILFARTHLISDKKIVLADNESNL